MEIVYAVRNAYATHALLNSWQSVGCTKTLVAPKILNGSVKP